MKKRLRQALAMCLALVLTACCLPAMAQYQKPYVLNVYDETPLNLSAYRGKALLIHYFTEKDESLQVNMENIKKVSAVYSPDELQIILVHVCNNEDESNTQNVSATYGMEGFTFLEDDTGAIANALTIPSTPFLLFIDKQGFLEDAVSFVLEERYYYEIIDYMQVSRLTEPLPSPEPTPETSADTLPTAILVDPTSHTAPEATTTTTVTTTQAATTKPATNSDGSPVGSKGIVFD